MSHYAVLVIRKKSNPVSYEEALERYYEGRDVEPYIYKTYAEIVEEAKDRIERGADNEKIKALLDGMKKADWIEKYSRVIDKSHEDSEYKMYKRCAKALKDHRAGKLTDKDYHDFYCRGDEDNLDEEGNILSTYNPESKWDWFQVGGRWSGELILKKGKRKDYCRAETVDEALKGDIDWAAMNSLDPERREWAKKFWKYHVMGEPYPGTEDEKTEEIGHCFYKPEYYLARYKTIDGYLKSLSTWCLRAVLDDDGEWHEVGEMGWFGCSSETEDESAAWEDEFYDKYIKPLPDDATLTVVDCHI